MATTPSSQLPNPPPPLEVRCAGCGETLELEPGMIEFICPDCHTPQTLPPELMPRKRKALPMPRGVGSSKIQLPCGSCSALLNVPHGLARFVCPKCGVELAVDQEKLRGYLAGSSVAADVAVVVPSAVRLPLAVDVELQLEVGTTNPSFMAPLFSPAANIEQNHMITPSRAQQDLSINSDHLDQSPVSRTLFSSSINANNIHTSIPSSTTPVPCHLNVQQIEEPEEKEEQEENEEESTPTPPHTTKTKPIKKGNNKNKKRSVGPTTKEIESSLRRSKRLAQSSPSTKKHKTQSQPSQSQPIQIQPIQSQPSQSEDNETPLDIARHYNNLLLDPGSPNGQGDINKNSDDEGDEEAYVAESDSSQSEPESQKKRGSIRVFSPSEDSEKRPRKGRGPNKLPNVPAPQNRPVIVIASDKTFAMKDKSLSNAKISRLIGNLVRQHTPGVVSFSDWDKTSKEMIWNEFLKYYQLDVTDGNMETGDGESDTERDAQDVEREARKVFESWAKTLYRKALNQARDDLKKIGIEDPTEWAKHPPKFMEKHKDAWAECCQIWSTEEWQEKSRRASENRQAGAEVVHLGGSVNSCEIMRKLQQENPDRTITYIDVAKKMKMRPSGEWVDPKAQQTVGDYDTNMINEHGENWRVKHPDDPNIWLASSGGNNHGHIYMIGSVIKSKRLKKRQGSRRTKPAMKSSSSHGGRWITKDGSDKIEDLNKQHEEDQHEIERLRKQHEEDRKEIEMLREKQMEQEERSRLLEEKQSSGREEMDSLREEMMEMRKMIKITSSASSTRVMPRRAVRSQPRPSYHE